MTIEEIWTTYLIPILQFLVAPLLAGGGVLLYFKHKNTNKDDKDKVVRQLNMHYSKMNIIINLAEEISNDLDVLEDCEIKINQMKNGDFSGVKDELKEIKDENDCLQLFVNNKNEISRKITKQSQNLKRVFNEYSELPSDLLPTHIHVEVIEIVDSKRVELEREKIKRYKTLLKNIKKAM